MSCISCYLPPKAFEPQGSWHILSLSPPGCHGPVDWGLGFYSLGKASGKHGSMHYSYFSTSSTRPTNLSEPPCSRPCAREMGKARPLPRRPGPEPVGGRPCTEMDHPAASGTTDGHVRCPGGADSGSKTCRKAASSEQLRRFHERGRSDPSLRKQARASQMDGPAKSL